MKSMHKIRILCWIASLGAFFLDGCTSFDFHVDSSTDLSNINEVSVSFSDSQPCYNGLASLYSHMLSVNGLQRTITITLTINISNKNMSDPYNQAFEASNVNQTVGNFYIWPTNNESLSSLLEINNGSLPNITASITAFDEIESITSITLRVFCDNNGDTSYVGNGSPSSTIIATQSSKTTYMQQSSSVPTYEPTSPTTPSPTAALGASPTSSPNKSSTFSPTINIATIQPSEYPTDPPTSETAEHDTPMSTTRVFTTTSNYTLGRTINTPTPTTGPITILSNTTESPNYNSSNGGGTVHVSLVNTTFGVTTIATSDNVNSNVTSNNDRSSFEKIISKYATIIFTFAVILVLFCTLVICVLITIIRKKNKNEKREKRGKRAAAMSLESIHSLNSINSKSMSGGMSPVSATSDIAPDLELPARKYTQNTAQNGNDINSNNVGVIRNTLDQSKIGEKSIKRIESGMLQIEGDEGTAVVPDPNTATTNAENDAGSNFKDTVDENINMGGGKEHGNEVDVIELRDDQIFDAFKYQQEQRKETAGNDHGASEELRNKMSVDSDAMAVEDAVMDDIICHMETKR